MGIGEINSELEIPYLPASEVANQPHPLNKVAGLLSLREYKDTFKRWWSSKTWGQSALKFRAGTANSYLTTVKCWVQAFSMEHLSNGFAHPCIDGMSHKASEALALRGEGGGHKDIPPHVSVGMSISPCNWQGANYKSVQQTRSAVAAGKRDWADGTRAKLQSYQSAGVLRSPAHPPSPRWARSRWALPGKEVLHCARKLLSCWEEREMINLLPGASGKQNHYQPILQTQRDCVSWWW